jgi:hypothetical protein
LDIHNPFTAIKNTLEQEYKSSKFYEEYGTMETSDGTLYTWCIENHVSEDVDKYIFCTQEQVFKVFITSDKNQYITDVKVYRALYHKNHSDSELCGDMAIDIEEMLSKFPFVSEDILFGMCSKLKINILFASSVGTLRWARTYRDDLRTIIIFCRGGTGTIKYHPIVMVEREFAKTDDVNIELNKVERYPHDSIITQFYEPYGISELMIK